MIKHCTFSHHDAARFYDRLGSGLDTQGFYESRALRELAAHLNLETAQAVLEFGCGTGRFAAELLQTNLASTATY
jgi:cyclopropane fatty-acyl-phospholipid synthase-like methyltransferase